MISFDLFSFACFRISFWFSAETVTSATFSFVPSAVVFSVIVTSVGDVVVPALVSVTTALTSTPDHALAAAESLYKDGWYDFSNSALQTSWMQFANALVQGHIVISDLYSNTQVMTGEVAGGMGSSASILYYNDTVTYPDNTTEPMNLQILPMPRAAGGKLLASQAGVGLCALKTTAQKQEAVSLFAHWLTESDRNLAFAAQTGYMPVTYDAFDAIKDYNFNNAAFERLYRTFTQVQQSAQILSEPAFAGFYGKAGNLYEALRAKQKDYAKRSAGGADTEQLSEQTWKLFQGIS